MFDSFDIVVVGAGISGLTIAREYAEKVGKKVLVIDKRNHVGGNCYDYIDDASILVPKYGPHYFHTNDEEVWEYVSQYTEWRPFEARILSYIEGKYVPIPVNIDTVNILLELSIEVEEEMLEWLEKNTKKFSKPSNSMESCISRVGEFLYEKMFKYYTKKHWDLFPEDLDPSVLDRIPVRTNRDDRYFTDKYQGMPKNGYASLFKNMCAHKNIEIMFEVDYFEVKDKLRYEKIFYTGPIDRYFSYCNGSKLQYRSVRFEYETMNQEYFLPAVQVNFPNDHEYTRITEPKHATGQKALSTTVIREYPTWIGEEFYPVPNETNRKVYREYAGVGAENKHDNVYFLGRLARYKYINMDQAFREALDLFKELENGY